VNVRILVIEDDAPIRRFLEAALTNAGYEVVEAETGRGGLTQILARMPDLVILDLGLPDMDGMEIITRVREWSQVPIVILSARGRENDKVDALNAGADEWRLGTLRFFGRAAMKRPRDSKWVTCWSTWPAGVCSSRVPKCISRPLNTGCSPR
jgi:CheY-like chemotaxis protein